MSAIIISAFPACGKSTFYNKFSTFAKEPEEPLFDILDSDSSLFSWVYDGLGNKSNVRNPEFPNNYIRHIKENMDKVDIIFVSSHKSVRDALQEEGIPYYLVYPKKELLAEWIQRFEERGNDPEFIKFQENNWDNFIDDMDKETYPYKIKLLDGNSYSGIDTELIANIIKYNLKETS